MYYEIDVWLECFGKLCFRLPFLQIDTDIPQYFLNVLAVIVQQPFKFENRPLQRIIRNEVSTQNYVCVRFAILPF